MYIRAYVRKYVRLLYCTVYYSYILGSFIIHHFCSGKILPWGSQTSMAASGPTQSKLRHCIHMYIRMYVRTYARKYVHMYVRTYALMHKHTHISFITLLQNTLDSGGHELRIQFINT